MGLFFFSFPGSTRFTQEMEEKGPDWRGEGEGEGEGGDRGGEWVRVVAFQLLYKPSEPSLSRPLVISEHCFQSQCNRRIIY